MPEPDLLYGSAVSLEGDVLDEIDDVEMAGSAPEMEMDVKTLSREEPTRGMPADEFKAQLSAPMPAPTAVPGKALRMVTKSFRKAAEEEEDLAFGTLPEQSEELELAAATDMLSYGALRLGGADDRHRGILRTTSVEERYIELLARVKVSVSVDVALAIRMAHAHVSRVAKKEPPRGHIEPESWEGFDFSYFADSMVSIPSDENFHNIPLTSSPGKVEVRHISVPRESLDVFRFLCLTNPMDAPLPVGPADVYIGRDYLLTSQIHTVAPGGAIELGLGVDEAVKIARNVHFSEHTSGLLGGNLGLSHEISIDVTNNLPRTVDLEVRERIPTSREGDDKVSVEVKEVDPPWKPYDQNRMQIENAYCWQIDVPAGASKAMKVTYEISLSAKHEIVGGNRREQ
jgi:hypothetical protein